MNFTEQDLEVFNQAIKESSPYDFSDYSEKSLIRRITKIMIDHQLNVSDLLNKIRNDHNFVEFIVKEVTVNTTELFRDPSIWHVLRYQILPKFKDHKNINIWHAGCSTGQEVYSLMILLNEMDMLHKVHIYASDINTDVIEKARLGEYRYRFNINYLDNFDKVIKENPYNYDSFNDVPYEKYFSINESKDFIKMHSFLTEKPIYKKHDLVKDPNVFQVKFDIIFCRNVMIYFNFNLQNKVVKLFYDNLFDGGHLILGKQESIRGSIALNFEKFTQVFIKKTLNL